jgi:CheY-like chemotaxis protein
VTPDTRRRLSAQNDELRAENEHLKNTVANLKEDLSAVTRDRDATRQAWITLKAERKAAGSHEHAPATDTGSAGCLVVVADAPIATRPGSDAQPADKPLISPEAHRAMAAVLVKAPALLDSVRAALEKAIASPLDETIRAELRGRATGLADCMLPINGHPVQRLAASVDALVREPGAFDAMTARTLKQGAELARTLLAGKHLKRVKELSHPRVLAIDDDDDLLTTLVSALGSADILTSGVALPSAALALLHDKHFDLILLDVALPEESGIDLCPKIREIPGYKATPIVFVTARDTIDNRAQSSLGGGNDFITKPFNTLELTLKAQIWIYRYQFALI